MSVVKKGFPVPSREDDHAPLLEMTDGPAPDVRLRHLADGDRREHARVDAALLESVLDRQAVEDGGEHARVVRGGAIHAFRGRLHPAVDVPAPSTSAVSTPIPCTVSISSASDSTRARSIP